jgi:hypothetical protein
MLEALISLRRAGGTGAIGGADKTFADLPDKRAGDIVVVKRRPCAWSELERRHFLITLIRDDDLETEMQLAGHDVRTSPYQVLDDEGHPVCRSKYRIDLAPFAGTPGLDSGDVTAEPTLPTGKSCLELADLNRVWI